MAKRNAITKPFTLLYIEYDGGSNFRLTVTPIGCAGWLLFIVLVALAVYW